MKTKSLLYSRHRPLLSSSSSSLPLSSALFDCCVKFFSVFLLESIKKCSVDRKRVIFVVVESGRESHANDAHAPTNQRPAQLTNPQLCQTSEPPPTARPMPTPTDPLVDCYIFFFIVKTMPPRNPPGIPARANAPACWLLYFGQLSALIRPIGKGLFCFCGGWEVEPCQQCPVLPHPLGARATLSKGKGGRSGLVPLV